MDNILIIFVVYTCQIHKKSIMMLGYDSLRTNYRILELAKSHIE